MAAPSKFLDLIGILHCTCKNSIYCHMCFLYSTGFSEWLWTAV